MSSGFEFKESGMSSVVVCSTCHVSTLSADRISQLEEAPECQSCHNEGSTRFLPVAQEKHLGRQKQLGKVKITDMVVVPSGTFIMGYDHRHPDEKPQHIEFTQSFSIDKYEVTNQQYKEFIDMTHRPPPENWINNNYPPAKSNHPIAFVTWFDSRDYCAWVGKRLPTETEWEKAARGEDGRLYPWGNEFDPRKANTPQSHIGDTTPVGNFPAGRSPYGLYDVSGNVWEWTDSWAKPYPGSPIPNGHYFTGEYKVLRGGSWVDCSFYRCGISALTFNRGYFKPMTRNKGFGFRCAKNILQS